MISLFTLNLWRYYDFDLRFPKIIRELKEKQPDVIFLQEVQIDKTKSPFSQVELIKKELSEYIYSLHSTIYLKTNQRNEKLVVPIQHGMAVLSKYPIVNSFEYYLPLQEGNEEPRSILCCDIDINGVVRKFANIHFTNNEEMAKDQIGDFLGFIKSRNEERIMVGDFNMFHLYEYKSLLKGYKLSYDYKKYISYPKDNGTLDYILIPESCEFESLELINEDLSDHKGIFIKISN